MYSPTQTVNGYRRISGIAALLTVLAPIACGCQMAVPATGNRVDTVYSIGDIQTDALPHGEFNRPKQPVATARPPATSGPAFEAVQASFKREVLPIARPERRRDLTPSVEDTIRFARNLEQREQIGQAIRQYESIRAGSSTNPFVLHRLAVLYDLTGQSFRSLPLYEQALQLDPANPELLCDFGFRWHQVGDPYRAEQYYRRALRTAPKHTRTHNNFAVLLAQHHFEEPAMNHFVRAGLSREEAAHNLAVARRTEESGKR